MKRILLALLLFVHASVFASITDLKLSTAQIFDVQWNISGNTLNASGFNYIYSSINYATQSTSAARWTAAQTSDANSNGRYIGFFNSTTNPGTYGMAVFNADGTTYKIINNTGSFRAIADGAIFYNGNGMWGTLITTGQGYSLGQSGNWAVTQQNPTNAQLQAYNPPSSTPLASGQTAQATPPPSAPAFDGTLTQTNAPSNQTVTSGSGSTAGITPAQQTRVNVNQPSATTTNLITVDQVSGTNNTVRLEQVGSKNTIEFSLNGNNNMINGTQTGINNYMKMEVPGWGNNITTTQTNNVGYNYTETKIQGNGNTVNHTQNSNANQVLFSMIAGDINTVTTSQTGTGAHYLETRLTGNYNSVTATQSGSTGNRANIDVTNAGGSATVDLQQTGGRNFTLIQSCVNPAGCSTTVRQ